MPEMCIYTKVGAPMDGRLVMETDEAGVVTDV